MDKTSLDFFSPGKKYIFGGINIHPYLRNLSLGSCKYPQILSVQKCYITIKKKKSIWEARMSRKLIPVHPILQILSMCLTLLEAGIFFIFLFL